MPEPYLGRIEVTPRAIATIAGLVVLESYGVVGMASQDAAPRALSQLTHNQGLARLGEYVAGLLPRANFRRGVAVQYRDGGVVIDLFVIIEYGTRISQVAQGIKNHVKYIVERDTGLPVEQVNVHVEGLRVSGDP